MKWRPIMFSAQLIPKVMDGTKTQTRRLMNPQPVMDRNVGLIWKGAAFGITTERYPDGCPVPYTGEIIKKAPKGRVGDGLSRRRGRRGGRPVLSTTNGR